MNNLWLKTFFKLRDKKILANLTKLTHIAMLIENK